MSLLGNPTDPKRRIKYGSRNEGASIAPPGAAIEQQAENDFTRQIPLFAQFRHGGSAFQRADRQDGKLHSRDNRVRQALADPLCF